ncbi:EthD domain-containing protein [Streptomyces olivaceoviridis]|uniref:EthD domain-containing protein n=1 Tax=Streptomyces olivaceoviridis TaxID=1921 RepID=UPI0036C3900B
MAQLVKGVACIRHRADLPAEEFTRYWLENHSRIVQAVAGTLSIRRYVQSHLLPGPLTEQFTASRNAIEPFDGLAEVWIDADEFGDGTTMTEERLKANLALVEDEGNFIDLERSAFFFTVEHEFVGPEA